MKRTAGLLMRLCAFSGQASSFETEEMPEVADQAAAAAGRTSLLIETFLAPPPVSSYC